MVISTKTSGAALVPGSLPARAIKPHVMVAERNLIVSGARIKAEEVFRCSAQDRATLISIRPPSARDADEEEVEAFLAEETDRSEEAEGGGAKEPAGKAEGGGATKPAGKAEGGDATKPTGKAEGGDATKPTG